MPAKLTIDYMRDLAVARGGECLTENYVNSHTHLQWRCNKGHEWSATPSTVMHVGSWCPECAGRVKYDLDYLQEFAAKKGGRLVSDTYTRIRDKYVWQCSNRHRWFATADSVLRGTWCPQCSNLLSERICRAILESIFEIPFPTERPGWLVNEWGNQMELDCFNESLSLALEYNGKQHYQRLPIYHKSQEAFDRLQKSDKTKKKLCKENSINLIVVPYTVSTEKLGDYIFQECKKLGHAVPDGWQSAEVDLSAAYSPNKLKELKNLAESRGGNCLSKHYLGVTTKHEWECAKGHRWKAIPDSVKNGSWCPECGGTSRKTIADAKELALAKGGECLSENYQNNQAKLLWRCDVGHEWKATYANVQRGAWCHKCGGSKQKTLEDMHNMAVNNGGLCLSTKYVSSHKKLLWECSEGHRWCAIPTNIQQGKWCPECRDSTLTLEQMKKLAKQRGGKCLSTEYVNNRTHLEWECAEGHRWKAQPRHIVIGRWCRKCASKSRRKTIEDMQLLAKNRGGKCLSTKYVNVKTHLEWECELGHRWMAKPNNIQQGKWCPECKRLRQIKNRK